MDKTTSDTVTIDGITYTIQYHNDQYGGYATAHDAAGKLVYTSSGNLMDTYMSGRSISWSRAYPSDSKA